MRLVLEGAQQWARGMKDAAAATKEAGAAAEGEKRKFDAAAEAIKQMEARRNAAATRQARLGVDADFAASERSRVTGSLAAQRQSEAARAASYARAVQARGVGSFAAASAIAGGVLSGGGNALNQVESTDSYGRAVAKVTASMAEGIPIIGSFVGGMRQFVGAVQGVDRAVKSALEGLATSERSTSLQGSIRAARAGGAAELRTLGLTAGDAGIARDVAGRQLARLTPGLLSSFQDPDLGDPRRAAFQARGAAEAAGLVADRRRAELARFQGSDEFRNPLARAAEARRASDAARGAADQADRAKAQGSFPSPENDIKAAEARARASQLQNTLAQAEADAQRSLNGLKERAAQLQEAELAAARSRADLARAELEVQKARLTVLDRSVDKAKQAALAAGLAGPGELEEIQAVARRVRDQGTAGIPPELLQKALAFGPTSNLLTGAVTQAGAGNQTLQSIQREFGGGTLQDLERERAALASAIDTAAAQVEKELAATVETKLTEGLKKIGAAIVAAVESAAGQLVAEAGKVRDREQFQRHQAGG